MKHIFIYMIFFLIFLLSGCSLNSAETNDTPFDTEESSSLVPSSVSTSVPSETSSLKQEASSSQKEASAEISFNLKQFIEEQDSNFLTLDSYLQTDSLILASYNSSDSKNPNLIHHKIAMVFPDTNSLQIIDDFINPCELYELIDPNSFILIRNWTINEYGDIITPVFPELLYYTRNPDNTFSFTAEPYVANIFEPNPIYRNFSFGTEGFSSAQLTNLMVNNGNITFQHNITPDAERKTVPITHISFYPNNPYISVTIDCNSEIFEIPDLSSEPLIENIIFSEAEEGVNFDIYLSDEWDGSFYASEAYIEICNAEKETTDESVTYSSFYTAETTLSFNIQPSVTEIPLSNHRLLKHNPLSFSY